jgi:flagellin
MSLRINNNVEAFNTHRQLVSSADKMAKSMERLSSGYRINRAADDAAGLATSEKMRGQITGLAQAQRNVQDGVSMVQTAEGSLNEVHSMLQRVRELAVQYQNDSLSPEDKSAVQGEVNQLVSEMSRTRDSAAFNDTKLLDGSGSAVKFQVGANDDETISASFSDLATSLGAEFDLDGIHAGVASGGGNTGGFNADGSVNGAGTGAWTTAHGSGTNAGVASAGGNTGGFNADGTVNGAGTGAWTTAAGSGTAVSMEFDLSQVGSIDLVDEAIKGVSAQRADLGAVQNRLGHTLNSLSTYQENLVSAESRIRDVDMAKEMVEFTKSQILQQAGTSMLSQANQAPQSVLSLLR